MPPFEREKYPWKGLLFHWKGEWGGYALDRMGIPVFYSDTAAKGIHLLAGGQIDCCTDAELKQMLSRSVLIDGPAAELLTWRGFAEMMGVSAAAGKGVVKGNRKEAADGKYAVAYSAAENPSYLKMLPGACFV